MSEYAYFKSPGRDLKARRLREQEIAREERRLDQITTTLTDSDRMKWGTHADKKLGEVPFKYWRWFILQDWARSHPELLAYAELKLAGRCLAKDAKVAKTGTV